MRDASDRIIFALLACLILFGLLAFFVSPAYEKGVWAVVGAIITALSGVLGFKFGVHIPKPDGAQQQAAPQGQNERITQ
jgi:hypothetical protein